MMPELLWVAAEEGGRRVRVTSPSEAGVEERVPGWELAVRFVDQ